MSYHLMFTIMLYFNYIVELVCGASVPENNVAVEVTCCYLMTAAIVIQYEYLRHEFSKFGCADSAFKGRLLPRELLGFLALILEECTLSMYL